MFERGKNISTLEHTGIAKKGDLLLALLYAGNQPQVKKDGDEASTSIEGITRLEKLLFLLVHEYNFLNRVSSEETLNFLPFKMGPWSADIYDELDFFEALNILKKNKENKSTPSDNASYEELLMNTLLDKYESNIASENKEVTDVFALTAHGRDFVKNKIWRLLQDEDKRKIREIKKRFNTVSLRQLLTYVYKNYPEYATESEIKESLGL